MRCMCMCAKNVRVCEREFLKCDQEGTLVDVRAIYIVF